MIESLLIVPVCVALVWWQRYRIGSLLSFLEKLRPAAEIVLYAMIIVPILFSLGQPDPLYTFFTYQTPIPGIGPQAIRGFVPFGIVLLAYLKVQKYSVVKVLALAPVYWTIHEHVWD